MGSNLTVSLRCCSTDTDDPLSKIPIRGTSRSRTPTTTSDTHLTGGETLSKVGGGSDMYSGHVAGFFHRGYENLKKLVDDHDEHQKDLQIPSPPSVHNTNSDIGGCEVESRLSEKEADVSTPVSLASFKYPDESDNKECGSESISVGQLNKNDKYEGIKLSEEPATLGGPPPFEPKLSRVPSEKYEHVGTPSERMSKFGVYKQGPRDIGRVQCSNTWTPAEYDVKTDDSSFLQERSDSRRKDHKRKVSRKMGPREIGRIKGWKPANYGIDLKQLSSEDFLKERTSPRKRSPSQKRNKRKSSKAKKRNPRSNSSRPQVVTRIKNPDLNLKRADTT